MTQDKLNVCVCIPTASDNRPEYEQADTLERFRRLYQGTEFHFVEYVDPPEIRALRGQPDFDKARDKVRPPSDELKAALTEAHVIFCVDLPFDMDRLAPNLRWVQSVGAGIAQLQNCGLDRLNGVLLTNGAGITADPIAEFVMARVLSHWKCFAQLQEQQQRHQWRGVHGRDIDGSTLGVVGYGAIGRAVAWRAAPSVAFKGHPIDF